MSIAWHAQYYKGSTYVSKEVSCVDEAIAYVEKSGGGTVIKFYLEPNLPHCLPEFIYRSSAMWSYDRGVWSKHAIFSCNGDKIGEEKPH